MSEGNGYATIDELLSLREAPRRYRDVVLPVSKLKLKIQSLTEKEKSDFEADAMNRDGTGASLSRIKDSRRRFIQKCVVEPKIETAHIAHLGGIDGADLGHLHTECAAHAGWSAEDIAKLEGN